MGRGVAVAVCATLMLGGVGRLEGQGCGFYFMKPPLLANPPTDAALAKEFLHWQDFDEAQKRDTRAMAMIDRNAGIPRWSHDGTFDTALACEQYRARMLENAKAEGERIRKEFPSGLPTLGWHLVAESRCISSVDPRLAGR